MPQLPGMLSLSLVPGGIPMHVKWMVSKSHGNLEFDVQLDKETAQSQRARGRYAA